MSNHKNISKKAGLPPGSLIYIGKQKQGKTKITLTDYDKHQFTIEECQHISDTFSYKNKHSVSWINIDGLHDTDMIFQIGNHFELHPLVLEDILNTKHRPKVEDFGHYLFLSVKMLSIHPTKKSITIEQVSFVLGKHWLITFQERQGDTFDIIRKRLADNTGKMRQLKEDYLFYRLLDTIVDHYFFIIEYFSEATEKLEEKILSYPDDKTLYDIQLLKKNLVQFRKSVVPLRELITSVQKDAPHFITENTNRYLHDVYEHIIHINESIEIQKDLLSSLMDLYMTGISNKMNQVMQVLTIIATIFIPLSFIAGVYGMNFDHMPELHWKYGYHAVWILMLGILITMLVYFKRKKWL